MDYRWKSWLQLLLGLGLTFLFFYMMAPFVVAILLGAVTAILWYPVYDRLQKKVPPSLSAFGVTFGVAVGILIPLFFILYSATYKLLQLISNIKLPKGGTSPESLFSNAWLDRILGGIGRFTPVSKDWIRDQVTEILQGILERGTKLIATSLAGTPGLLVAFFVVIISLYFFLRDGGAFLRFLSSLSPLKSERSEELYHTFERSCRGVVFGIFSSAIAQGIIVTILFAITGLANPILMGLLTIIAGMVPVVGSAPIWIGATIYLFAQKGAMSGITMLVGGIIISIADNAIRAWVMSGKGEMHPMLALVSVFGAVNLVGATGIFLGPVIAAVFVSFLKILSQEIRRENIASIAARNPEP